MAQHVLVFKLVPRRQQVQDDLHGRRGALWHPVVDKPLAKAVALVARSGEDDSGDGRRGHGRVPLSAKTR
jgi:hypothetical protein